MQSIAKNIIQPAQSGDVLTVNDTGGLHSSGAEFDSSTALYGFRIGDRQLIRSSELGLTGYFYFDVTFARALAARLHASWKLVLTPVELL